jgi:hypothetical protein
VTASASVGAALRWGPLSVTIDPIVFWAQNQSFPLLANGRTGPDAYGDGIFPTAVDRPQRFGDEAYSRVDPGQSSVRLDALGMSLGFSTANLWWGPAQEYPFLLGTNAAGFPHVFVGTSRPANLWLLKAHTQIIWGQLEQSDYFVPVGIERRRRFATGLILAVTPRGLDNLELGAARFFHAPWPDEGLPGRYIGRPFEGLIKKNLPDVDHPIPQDQRSQDGENQLASVFARLVFPGTGFEAYAEFGREDHPWDIRYILLSPDEQSALTLGFRKTWRRGVDSTSLVTLRGESIDFRQTLIDFKRGGRAIYVHANGSNQGHTQRGQLLGADVGRRQRRRIGARRGPLQPERADELRMAPRAATGAPSLRSGQHRQPDRARRRPHAERRAPALPRCDGALRRRRLLLRLQPQLRRRPIERGRALRARRAALVGAERRTAARGPWRRVRTGERRTAYRGCTRRACGARGSIGARVGARCGGASN